MAEVLGIQEDIDKIAKNTGMTVPTYPQGRVQWRHLVSEQAKTLGIGKSAEAFNHKEANSWLDPHNTVFGEADYISGSMQRAETYPCKTVLARGRNIRDVKCRRCGITSETIGHISNHCHVVKDCRLKRPSR
jgi:hypothetical protein